MNTHDNQTFSGRFRNIIAVGAAVLLVAVLPYVATSKNTTPRVRTFAQSSAVLAHPPLTLSANASSSSQGVREPKSLISQDLLFPKIGNKTGARSFNHSTTSPLGTSSATSSTDSHVAGTQSVLWVSVDWTGNPMDSTNPIDIQNQLNQVQNFYQQVSNGQFDFTAKVLPVVVTISDPGVSCSDGNFWSAVQANTTAALTAQGIPVSQYDHVISYIPQTSSETNSCNWMGGMGDEPGQWVWMFGADWWQGIAHELGHNLGLGHASLLKCTDAQGNPVAISSSCIAQEYQNPFDLMGNSSYSVMFDVPHLLQLGWLPSSAQASLKAPTVGSVSKTWTLGPLEDPSGSNVRAIGLTESNGATLWLESRYMANADSALAPADNGIVMNLVPTADAQINCDAGYLCMDNTFLVDPAAGQATAGTTFSLPVGSTWVDPTGAVSITTTPLGSGVYQVTATLTSSAGAPTISSLSVRGNDATIAWTTGLGAQQGTATDYVLQCFNPDGTISTSNVCGTQPYNLGVNSPATISIDTNGGMRFEVTALDAMGDGTPSAMSNVVSLGAPPLSGKVTASPRGDGAYVRWSYRQGSGNVVTSAIVTPFCGGGALSAVKVNYPSNSVVVRNLLGKFPCSFTVSQVNSVGVGPASKPSNAIVRPKLHTFTFHLKVSSTVDINGRTRLKAYAFGFPLTLSGPVAFAVNGIRICRVTIRHHVARCSFAPGLFRTRGFVIATYFGNGVFSTESARQSLATTTF